MSPRLPLLGTDHDVSTATARVVFSVVVILFLLLSVANALTYTPLADRTPSSPVPSENLTFVSTQGTATTFAAGIYAVDMNSATVVWSYTDCPDKCFDIDPVGNDTILFVAPTSTRAASDVDNPKEYPWHATLLNRRTGEIKEQFPVPYDTHDVDAIGDGKYIVAAKGTPRKSQAGKTWKSVIQSKGYINESRIDYPGSNLLYIFDSKTNEITWTYDFQKHYPPTAGTKTYSVFGEGGNTHLNDVESVKNGSAVLASPRNYDRVVLINRSTKRTVWTLGEEDNYSILNEQHNPDLLSTDPPTVLVADSGNDRVVEYEKEGDGWTMTWQYHGDLDWPRDADRLPNGNTLIVDSLGDRILVVTPEKKIVREMDIPTRPYDAERLGLPDESAGPPMRTILNNTSASATQEDPETTGILGTLAGLWETYYRLSGWVFPPWMDQFSFASLHVAVLSLVGWIRFEWKR